MQGIDIDSKWTALLPGFAIAGIGIGLVNPPLASTAVGVVPPEQSGMASGINTTFRQIGIATGIAGLGAIFQSHVSSTLATELAGTPSAANAKELGRAVTSGALSDVVQRSACQRAERGHPRRHRCLHLGLPRDFLRRRRDRTRRRDRLGPAGQATGLRPARLRTAGRNHQPSDAAPAAE